LNKELLLTDSWIREFIIGMDICPFAKIPYEDKRFRLSLCDKTTVREQKAFFVSEQQILLTNNSAILSNSFLVYPQGSKDYLEFLDFFYECEEILSQEFQLVCFHPLFYFASTDQMARINWVNRAPFPSLHLLRIAEVSAVISSEKMGEMISKSNEKKLMNLSEKEFHALTLKWQI
jgi:uncharacterized protein